GGHALYLLRGTSALPHADSRVCGSATGSVPLRSRCRRRHRDASLLLDQKESPSSDRRAAQDISRTRPVVFLAPELHLCRKPLIAGNFYALGGHEILGDRYRAPARSDLRPVLLRA